VKLKILIVDHSVVFQQTTYSYYITATHGSTNSLSLSKLEYQMLMEVKEAIKRNAEWHGLVVEE